jgi:heparanase 1
MMRLIHKTSDTLFSRDEAHLMRKRKIVDPKYLDHSEDTYRDMQLTLQRHGTWASAWVSESGGVFNNGRQLVSNTFMNSIWSAIHIFS